MQFSVIFRYFSAQNSPNSRFTLNASTSSWVLWTRAKFHPLIITKIKHYSHRYTHILQFRVEKWSFGVHKKFWYFFQNEKRVCQIYRIELISLRGPSYITNIMLKMKSKEFRFFCPLQGSLKKVRSFGVQTPVVVYNGSP